MKSQQLWKLLILLNGLLYLVHHRDLVPLPSALHSLIGCFQSMTLLRLRQVKLCMTMGWLLALIQSMSSRFSSTRTRSARQASVQRITRSAIFAAQLVMPVSTDFARKPVGKNAIVIGIS